MGNKEMTSVRNLRKGCYHCHPCFISIKQSSHCDDLMYIGLQIMRKESMFRRWCNQRKRKVFIMSGVNHHFTFLDIINQSWYN
jgi:hypothetical protein